MTQKHQELREKMGLSTNEKSAQALQRATKPNTLQGLNRKQIQDALTPLLPSMASSLPKHLTGERMFQIVVTAIDQNPAIKDCELSSVVGCIMQASILGFKPVNNLGQVYFIPYNDRNSGKKFLQMQIGYKGFIDLARRSGQIKMLYAEVVREGDHFDYEFGLNPKLEHKPSGDVSRKVTHVYAVSHYIDGGYNFIVMTRSEIERLRLRNPMQKSDPNGAWRTDWDAMAKAKVIKQLAKYMPLSDDMQTAVLSDESIVDVKKDNPDFVDEVHMFYPDTEAEYVEDEPESNEAEEEAGTTDDKPPIDLFKDNKNDKK